MNGILHHKFDINDTSGVCFRFSNSASGLNGLTDRNRRGVALVPRLSAAFLPPCHLTSSRSLAYIALAAQHSMRQVLEAMTQALCNRARHPRTHSGLVLPGPGFLSQLG